MSKLQTLSVAVPLTLGLVANASIPSVAVAAPAQDWVAAQKQTPGVPQKAHSNIAGTSTAGAFVGGGSGLIDLNASALADGTVHDARLSANVLLSSAIQTITGIKTFGTSPVFSDSTVPFVVVSSKQVDNLNADLLDGFDSSAFLQAVPSPLLIDDLGAGYAIRASSTKPAGAAIYAVHNGQSAQGFGLIGTSAFGTGLLGESMSGPYPGVWGRSLENAGVYGEGPFSGVWGDGVYSGVYGKGGVNGVTGITTNPSGSGVYGEHVYGGFGMAGRGAVGVFGEDNSPNGGTGVLGQSLKGTAVHAKSAQGDAIRAEGTVRVWGDFWVTGSKFGYVVDLVKNVDSVPLEPGAVVEIVGHEPAVVGTIPVTLVRNATSARAGAVLGPIDCAVTLETWAPSTAAPLGAEPAGQAEPIPGVERQVLGRAEGSVAPGAYGNVVTLGSFRGVRVDASYGAIRAGDALVASPNPGYAMASHDPRYGTVIGKALGDWSDGLGEVPVMVSIR